MASHLIQFFLMLKLETREWSLGRENSPFIQELVTSCRLNLQGFYYLLWKCVLQLSNGKAFHL